eukprot:TRINITY_DN25321_c0_g1_i1.p1 TRINITY_DN25321_c0_g1~~TRINITY_DN25321_c0_g1_i1.p1  ORF type:complete len:738 (+),score=216.90 TRINITY_DN25321_c0_g1_i1:57-2270(+)
MSAKRPFRQCVPHYDPKDLESAIDVHVFETGTDKALDLGPIYNSYAKTRAVHGSGLLHCLPLAKRIIKVAPACELLVMDLKAAISAAAKKYSSLNRTSLTHDLFAEKISDSIFIVLAHLRRIKRHDNRFQQATKALDALEIHRLRELLGNIRLEDETAGNDSMESKVGHLPSESDGEGTTISSRSTIASCTRALAASMFPGVDSPPSSSTAASWKGSSSTSVQSEPRDHSVVLATKRPVSWTSIGRSSLKDPVFEASDDEDFWRLEAMQAEPGPGGVGERNANIRNARELAKSMRKQGKRSGAPAASCAALPAKTPRVAKKSGKKPQSPAETELQQKLAAVKALEEEEARLRRDFSAQLVAIGVDPEDDDGAPSRVRKSVKKTIEKTDKATGKPKAKPTPKTKTPKQQKSKVSKHAAVTEDRDAIMYGIQTATKPQTTPWMDSPGFGVVKALYATAQSYIVYKERPTDDKQRLVVAVTEREVKWLTEKEAEETWGKKELGQRLQMGTVLRRRDPEDTRFWQYLRRQDAAELSIEKGSKFKAKGRDKVSGDQFRGLQGQLKRMKLTDKGLDDFCERGEVDWDDMGGMQGGEMIEDTPRKDSKGAKTVSHMSDDEEDGDAFSDDMPKSSAMDFVITKITKGEWAPSNTQTGSRMMSKLRDALDNLAVQIDKQTTSANKSKTGLKAGDEKLRKGLLGDMEKSRVAMRAAMTKECSEHKTMQLITAAAKLYMKGKALLAKM